MEGPVPSPPVRNTLEIQVFGLQRSGNHGVISWLLQQSETPVVFLNNVTHFTDPYLNFHVGAVPNMVPVSHNDPARIEALRQTPKPLLVYSYENLTLRRLAREPLVPDRDTALGPSRRIRRVLLLRDFFNWAASRIKLFEYRKQDVDAVIQNFDRLIMLWLSYAREFSAETGFLQVEDVVRVSYPRWAGDAEYRAYLLGRLGLPLRDNSNRVVPKVGGGSSFDTTTLSGQADKMAVGERWKYLRQDRFAPLRAAIRARRAEIEPLNHALFDQPWVIQF